MILLIRLVGIFLLQGVAATPWILSIESDNVIVHMNEVISVPLSVSINVSNLSNTTLLVNSSDTNIATANSVLTKQDDDPQIWNGTVNITGVFLGTATVVLTLSDSHEISSRDIFTVTVTRQERIIDSMFTVSVAILVSILYINYGCALDWGVCYETLKKPIGPAIGSFCQFILMPLLSYFIGFFLFPNNPELQLGMFFTGISPSGGASNIWTVLLGGNLNLSVTMTTICTVISFAMMPLWIFTLGRYIFERGDIPIPYSRIGVLALGLIIPLGIGYIIQKKLPRVSKLMVRIMKPFSAVLVIFIIIFATVTNLYLFKLFSLQIIIAGLGLPWLGFIFGLIVALIFKQPYADVKAIAIETGIQNTGVAIFLLRFTLKPPQDDLTTVVPVSSAIMTPIPLVVLYLIKIIWERATKYKSTDITLDKRENASDVPPIAKSTSSKPLIHLQ